MNKLTITLGKPVTGRNLTSIHVELRSDPGRPEYYRWELFCKDALGRERGTIYCYDNYDDSRKAAMNMYKHFQSYL